MKLSPELRAKLEARGLDPDDLYAAVLRDAEQMLTEIREGTWMIDAPLWWRNHDGLNYGGVETHRQHCKCVRCLSARNAA